MMNKTDIIELPDELTIESGVKASAVTGAVVNINTDLATKDPANQAKPQQNLAESLAKAGHLFRDARLAKNLSVQDVSNSLRLSTKQIEALENDNYLVLPAAMIVRGFMRNYARLLSVDAAPVLAAYKILYPEKTSASFTVQSTIKLADSSSSNYPWNKYRVASLLVLFGLLLWLLYVNVIEKSHRFGFEMPASVVQGEVSVATTLPEALPEMALPTAERQSMDEATPTLESTPHIGSATPVVSTLSAVAGLPKVEATSIVSSVNAPVSKFNFSVKESTWLSLTDANGQVVFSKTLSAGTQDSLQVQVQLPIKVVVGNVNGTTLTYNDKAVDLTNYTTLNVAKFSLK